MAITGTRPRPGPLGELTSSQVSHIANQKPDTKSPPERARPSITQRAALGGFGAVAERNGEDIFRIPGAHLDSTTITDNPQPAAWVRRLEHMASHPEVYANPNVYATVTRQTLAALPGLVEGARMPRNGNMALFLTGVFGYHTICAEGAPPGAAEDGLVWLRRSSPEVELAAILRNRDRLGGAEELTAQRYEDEVVATLCNELWRREDEEERRGRSWATRAD
ncbi:unnamed protein product [Discula destructiva]